MEIVNKFSGKNSNYTKFEFFQEYKLHTVGLNCEIIKSARTITSFKTEIFIFKRYLQCIELNIFQRYILCDYLKKLNKNKNISNTREMRDVYIEFLLFCVNYIQACQRDLWRYDKLDAYDIKPIREEYDLTLPFNLIQTIFTVLFQTILVENDLILFTELLNEINLMFSKESACVRKFILIYTFDSDLFSSKLMNIHNTYSLNINWEAITLKISQFLYSCVVINHTLEHPLDFSNSFINLLELLLRDGNEFSNLNMLTLALVLQYYTGKIPLNTNFIDNCLINMMYEPDIDFKVSSLFSFNCILKKMFKSGFILPIEYFNKISKFYSDISKTSIMLGNMFVFYLTVVYKFVDYKPTAEILTFLEYVGYDIDISLYLRMLNIILSKVMIHSPTIFTSLCLNHFIIDDDRSNLYAQTMSKFMKWSHRLDLPEYLSIIKKYPDCLQFDSMKYVKYNLVNITLFDKCKLYVSENLTLYELSEIEHLI